jgi:hypothetical protein
MDTEEIGKLQKKVEWFEKKYGPYIESRGLHNYKNLFKKPTSTDWIILFMIAGLLFVSWAYLEDTKVCREYVASFQVMWSNISSQKGLEQKYESINTTLFTFNDTLKEAMNKT